MDTDCEIISIKRRQDCQRRSKRLKGASQPVIIEQNQSLQSNDENVNTFDYDQGDPSMIVNETLFTHRSSSECSHSIGQASYQITKQGLIVKYEDSEDNTYKCDCCGAYF
ncbi:uncharacterized protein LOC112196675 isoform X2 [Rosa chinensis]|uniref:uncharacterized protein LOC112196675 isoform X2 n=1 Tax=Rosa chinensis TaxID=74649 RepID=UPI000D088459|nr:uncharacterized protein LOC112196675 isoform X2 [Rosa chinensis]